MIDHGNAVSQAPAQAQPIAYHFLVAVLDDSPFSTQHRELHLGKLWTHYIVT